MSSIFDIRSKKGQIHMENMFFEAVMQSNMNMAQACLNKGVDPNVLNEEFLTALHIAAEKGDISIGSVLLGSPKIEINKQCSSSMDTALMVACTFTQRNFLRLLLQHGADPNISNIYGLTALHMATKQAHMGLTFDLVMHGAHVNNVVSVFDDTPLSMAVIDNPSLNIAKFLLRKGARMIGNKQYPLFLECVLNCKDDKGLRIIDVLIAAGMDIHTEHPMTKVNCLHVVSATGFYPLAELLMDRGANMHALDITGRIPAMVAYEHEFWDIVRLFRTWARREAVDDE